MGSRRAPARRGSLLTLVVAGLASCERPADLTLRSDRTRCPQDAPTRASVGPRAFALAVTSRGTYVIAVAGGVDELDPCSLRRRGGCRDSLEARSLRVRGDDRVVDYLHADGSLGACDLLASRAAPPDPSALPSLTADQRVRSAQARAWVEAGQAWLEPQGMAPRRLPVPSEALSVALDPRGRWVAVADRAGGVAFFTAPGGLLAGREVPHTRNAYALAWDPRRERLLSIAGPGTLAVLRPPEGLRSSAW
ncbi:MAG: hypothetical protein HY909_10930 [Deltaproteobacteria bacterium]|nr:hypothetical protein [Deltaproteobacteria bacterium]